MTTTSRHTRILAIPIAGLAMVMAGLVATPTQAIAKAAKITVTVHIENAKGQPLRDLDVSAYKSDKWEELRENSKVAGEYKSTKMTKGKWTIDVYDFERAKPYAAAPTEYTVVAGRNVVPTITMDFAATVEGRVTAPSGRALNNVLVTVSTGDPQQPENGDDTDEDGSFSIAGLRPASYNFGYILDYTAFQVTPVVGPDRTLTAGEVATGQDITGVMVPARMTLRGKSSSKTNATLSVKNIGAHFGITDPGGSLSVAEGATTLVSGTAVTKGITRIPLTGLKKGKHKFTVSYSGGTDVRSQSKTVTVKVK